MPKKKTFCNLTCLIYDAVVWFVSWMFKENRAELEEHLKIITRYNTKKVGGYKPLICVPSDPFTLANQKKSQIENGERRYMQKRRSILVLS